MGALLVAGNWKMNGSRKENAGLLKSIRDQSATLTNSQIVVCVPFVYLAQVSELLSGSQISFGGQDISAHAGGAYTGEISAAMLRDFHCTYVIVGHSERRLYHHESNLLVAQKALSAIQGRLKPIICVGETLEQREAGNTLEVIDAQLKAIKSVLSQQDLQQSVIAYEPVWAIGTGMTATPDQAQQVHHFIRGQFGAVGGNPPILYGGSVKPANAAELFRQPDIDGALVGGASLIADDFITIARAGEPPGNT